MELDHSESKKLVEGIIITRAWRKGLIQSCLDEGWPLQDVIVSLDVGGFCLHRHARHNLITTAGRAMTLGMMANTVHAGLAYFAIGTGAAAAVIGDTALAAEVYRKAITQLTISGGQMVCSSYLLASECTYGIKECGLFGGDAASSIAGSGTLFSRYLEDYDNSAGVHDLTFEYNYSFS